MPVYKNKTLDSLNKLKNKYKNKIVLSATNVLVKPQNL